MLFSLFVLPGIKTIFAGSSANDVISTDHYNIISGHFDRKVRLWDVRSDSTPKEISLQGRVTSLDLSVGECWNTMCIQQCIKEGVKLEMSRYW